MRARLLVVLNIISFTGTLLVNTLANTLPINGKNTGELSALYPNEFVPAGYTFSIWLIIYLALTGFVIYQAGALRDESKRSMVETMGFLFLLTNLLNMGWILAWHYMVVWASVLIMLALLATLVIIHQRFNIPKKTSSLSEKLWLEIPFSLYLGWIMIATIANITTFLVHYNWNGYPLPGSVWAIIMVIIATSLCATILWRRQNYIIPLVAVWSIMGIVVKQKNQNGWNDVVVACFICSMLLLLFILYQANRKTEKLQLD